MKIRLRRLIHYVAALGPSILRLIGVKNSKSVAANVVEAAKAADAVLPKESDAPK